MTIDQEQLFYTLGICHDIQQELEVVDAVGLPAQRKTIAKIDAAERATLLSALATMRKHASALEDERKQAEFRDRVDDLEGDISKIWPAIG